VKSSQPPARTRTRSSLVKTLSLGIAFSAILLFTLSVVLDVPFPPNLSDLTPGFMAPGAQVTQWQGTNQNWWNPQNWNSGIPTPELDVIVSVGQATGGFDPSVSLATAGDTATVLNLTVQSGGTLRFASSPQPGVLVVHGNEKLQNDGAIILGNGTIIFKQEITFFQGGTFDAGSGTLEFQGVNWENKNGSVFNPGTSTVTFNGTSAQTLTGNITFYNLEINTPDMVSLSGNVTVTNHVTIAEGAVVNVPEGSSFIVEGTIENNGTFTGGGTIETPETLPVQLTSLTGTLANNDVRLAWSTASEVNNYGFTVERRRLGSIDWSEVGFVPGSGTSSSPKEYSFTDRKPDPGRYAYRIKQTDYDGSFAYYGGVEIEVGGSANTFSLHPNYPNPFNPSTNIEFSVPQRGQATVKVYDIQGREVAVLFNGEAEAGRLYRLTFDASGLASGIYIYDAQFGGQRIVRKMSFMK